MGRLHNFLGVKVVQDHKTGNVWIGQPSYMNNILTRFGMEDAKAIRTQLDTSTKLVKGRGEDTCVDQQLYLSAVGGLLYLSIATRPDVTYAKPRKQHWIVMKPIF